MTKLQARRIGERARRLIVVAAYEDFSTGARVNDFCRGLVRDLGGDSEVIKHLWLVNLLRLAQLRTIAAEDAAAADVIVLSFHEVDSLPEEVTSWVEMWLRRKGERRMVLVALVDDVYGKDRSAVRDYLEAVARRGDMGFFAQSWAPAEGQR